MQLYILDKDPAISASLIPDRYKFKMLIELGQLICSAGISNVYKSIPQGKELQEWVKENKSWILLYFIELYEWSAINLNLKNETCDSLNKIKWHLFESIDKITYEPNYAYFRYSKDYVCDIQSKTLLPIEMCINEYKKYVLWKNEQYKNKKLLTI